VPALLGHREPDLGPQLVYAPGRPRAVRIEPRQVCPGMGSGRWGYR
jgi:hypothetical protein